MTTREQTTAPPTAPVNGSVVSISLPSDTREVTSGKPSEEEMIALETKSLNKYYSDYLALEDISLQLAAKKIIAIIGPSGCGKSTLLRVFNRMNELIPGVRIEGQVLFNGQDLYAPSVDATEVRFRIGMVFQSRTRSPSRSTTTSPSGRASTATRATWTSSSSGRSSARGSGKR